jgi:hypothetical protein
MCAFWHKIKLKNNAVCAENEVSVIALLNEELDIDFDDQMDLENVEESASEESSNGMSESDNKSGTSVMRVDGWKDVTKINRPCVLGNVSKDITHSTISKSFSVRSYS